MRSGAVFRIPDELLPRPFQFNDLKAFVLKALFYENDGKILMGKAPIPYEAITSPEYLLRTSFPPQDEFYSSLRNRGVSNEEYEYGKGQFNMFGDRNMEDYMHRYNFIDVAGLNILIGERAKTYFHRKGIDIRTTTSMSQFSYMCMLRESKKSLEVLSEYSQLCLTNDNIRAGLSNIGRRYSTSTFCLSDDIFLKHCKQANGKYLVSTVLIFDENNQYGGAQCSPMAENGFKTFINTPVEKVFEALNLVKQGNSLVL